MTRKHKGTSELAILAEDLPARARVCLTLLAADIALQHLQRSPEFDLARNALAPALKWQKGERVDLDKWADMLEAEETSLAFAELRAQDRSATESLALCVLTYPAFYAAHHAFRESDRRAWGALTEVSEMTLDDLDKDLRALAPSATAFMTKAAAYLKQNPDASFGQLKARINRD